jgi:hypothetical protein
MDYFHNFYTILSITNVVFGGINFFILFTEITSLILKNDVVGQEQGAMAKFQLTGSLYKKVQLACVGSEDILTQNYCQQQS